MKKTAKLLSVLLCLALAIGMIATVAFAADEKTATLTSSALGLSNQDAMVETKIENITFTPVQGESQNAPKYYNSGTNLRFYEKTSLIITPDDGYTISSIALTTSSGYSLTDAGVAITNGTNNGDTVTPTDGTKAVTIANIDEGSGTPQLRIVSIVVTYTAAGGNGDSFDGCTSITYDFASVTETGKEIKDDALDFFNSMADDSHAHLVDASTTKVYQGNGSGGGTWANSGSIIKMGTGSVDGVLTLTFAEGSDIDSVDIWCHEWPGKNDSVDVNGVKKDAPNSGSIEKLSFELTSDTNVVTITTHYRAIISKIVVNGKIEVNTCTHANTEYVVTGAQHQQVCTDCSEPLESKTFHTFVDGACVCGTVIPTAETSIPDANEIGVKQDSYTNELYLVSGVITEIVKDDYGNLYIADEDGNKLYIYGTYSADGKTRYDAMDPKPVVGDTITVLGVMGQYKGDPQMKNAWVLDLIPGTPENPENPETPENPVAGAVKPVPGTAYKWGLYQATTKKWVFFAGSATEEGGRFMNTTTDFAKATDVYVEEAEGGYHIYFMDGTAKKYLGYHEVVNGDKTYNNLGILDEPTVWTWNEEYKTFQTNFGGKDYYVGTYAEFETLGGSETSYISKDGNFAAQFYAQDPAADTGDIAIGAIAALALVSGLGLAVIIKKKEF